MRKSQTRSSILCVAKLVLMWRREKKVLSPVVTSVVLYESLNSFIDFAKTIWSSTAMATFACFVKVRPCERFALVRVLNDHHSSKRTGSSVFREFIRNYYCQRVVYPGAPNTPCSGKYAFCWGLTIWLRITLSPKRKIRFGFCPDVPDWVKNQGLGQPSASVGCVGSMWCWIRSKSFLGRKIYLWCAWFISNNWAGTDPFTVWYPWMKFLRWSFVFYWVFGSNESLLELLAR